MVAPLEETTVEGSEEESPEVQAKEEAKKKFKAHLYGYSLKNKKQELIDAVNALGEKSSGKTKENHWQS